VHPSKSVKGKSSKQKPLAPLPYRNPRLSAEKRRWDLLSRMTLQEKAAQMVCIWRERPNTLLDDDGNFDLAKAKAAFKKGNGLGQVPEREFAKTRTLHQKEADAVVLKKPAPPPTE
jgi:hypothetical protein